ncbi:leucine-rich repeat-containing protein 59 isoform X1 [Eucyclogobius newberryi]|uniref:leucine-rich repeat-containing protein 59 isoform X1 n=1 Tax=Eucyclogobius newberryi TaxID=166745 RepID=UPI003B59E586
MSKNKLLNIKDKIEGNEVDLSLCNLTEAPVKELASVSKVTVVDLSCNNITMLTPEFCGLVHLVKLDLNKNHLESLPEDFGSLVNLQHLDLLGNRLSDLPVSFAQLRSLKWLDLKDNPLELSLSKAAGDCLDERQCRQCAAKVLEHMRGLQEEEEKIRQKKLQRGKELEKKRELKQREREAREREVKKREKAEEKERRRHEYNQQMAAQAAQEQQKKKQEEKKNGKATADRARASEPASEPRRSSLGLALKLLLLVLLGLLAVAAACHATDLRATPACRDVNVLSEQGLSWAQEHATAAGELLLSLSAGAKELLESKN